METRSWVTELNIVKLPGVERTVVSSLVRQEVPVEAGTVVDRIRAVRTRPAAAGDRREYQLRTADHRTLVVAEI